MTKMEDIVDYYVTQLFSYCGDMEYYIMGYSFGSLLAMEVASEFQSRHGTGMINKLVLLDGGVDDSKAHIMEMIKKSGTLDQDEEYHFVEFL